MPSIRPSVDCSTQHWTCISTSFAPMGASKVPVRGVLSRAPPAIATLRTFSILRIFPRSVRGIPREIVSWLF
jgi:hypothetical protein